jgi:hypothetical protein
LRDEGLGAWAMVAGAIVVSVVVWIAAGSFFWGSAALVAMLLSLWRLLLPARFELDRRGVTCHFMGRRRHVAWEAVGRFEIHPHGVLFLPDAEPAALDYFRGLFVPWGQEREAMTAAVTHYLGSPEGDDAERAPSAQSQA